MKTGIVVIGRNEGQRLVACLQSLARDRRPVVYVDSGSSDGSSQRAKELGADVIELSMHVPFTAARARNTGLARLDEKWPGLSFVQFVDGDCVVVEGWLDVAEMFLDRHHDVAVVCGRRREIRPNATIYNRLCDVEWDTPVGEANACGGDALMRLSVLRDVKGYRHDLIAGEEPELCLRLREKGWKIWRLPNEMTLHDANILHFSQWWRRGLRSGFAYAAVFTLHINSEKRIWSLELARAILWGSVFPLAIFAASVQHIAALGLFLVYPLQIIRIAVRRNAAILVSWQYALFITIAKFAEAAGVSKFLISRVMWRKIDLIEYK